MILQITLPNLFMDSKLKKYVFFHQVSFFNDIHHIMYYRTVLVGSQVNFTRFYKTIEQKDGILQVYKDIAIFQSFPSSF